mmetsp:Transcript_35118/g.80090  ORF Transcript_35118/g.80090 Transcript_35118/m.80090 type:complete len:99 (-) Transcript_35118:72-368(-)
MLACHFYSRGLWNVVVVFTTPPGIATDPMNHNVTAEALSFGDVTSHATATSTKLSPTSAARKLSLLLLRQAQDACGVESPPGSSVLLTIQIKSSELSS